MNISTRNSIIITLAILGLTILSVVKFIGPLMAKEDRHIDANDLYEYVENGDIIFQTSTSAQSKAIQIATGSKYSHMGIIYMEGDDYFVYEAVQPVKLTTLKQWINRGENQHFVIKRLKNSEDVLTPESILRMKQIGEKYAGKDYDLYFEWSDERIYCSELVWKIYKDALDIEIGKPEKLSDFNLNEKAVKQKLTERFGENIPLDELVISPAAMFNSELLTTVLKTGFNQNSITNKEYTYLQ